MTRPGNRTRPLLSAAMSGLALLGLWSTPVSSWRAALGDLGPSGWLDADPLGTASAFAWYLAVASASYLLLICAANLFASWRCDRQSARTRDRRTSGRAVRVLASLTPRFLAVASAGVILVSSPAGAADRPSPTSPPPVMELIDPADAPATSTAPHTSLPWARENSTPTTPTTPTTPLSPTTPATPATALSPTTPATPATALTTSLGDPEHLVRPGENFWLIAESTLTNRGPGTPPGVVEIADYWRQLIEANRDRLVDPAEPDLILTGQVFVLPR